MAKSAIPFQVVPVSIIAYGVLYQQFIHGAKQNSLQARVKALSAAHTTVATVVILFALFKSPFATIGAPVRSKEPTHSSDGNLDDSETPLIQDRSNFANAITAWETGYLLYDTWAMIYCAQPGTSLRGFADSAVEVARRQPALFWHHVALSCAFLRLQQYIILGRERGIWIILAFMLMNASSPLMHARWWARRAGKSSTYLDASFAAVFAISRFGLVAWVLRRYGAYHGLQPMAVYKKLRISCQMGTGALVGLNALWWAILVKGIIRRFLRDSNGRG